MVTKTSLILEIFLKILFKGGKEEFKFKIKNKQTTHNIKN